MDISKNLLGYLCNAGNPERDVQGKLLWDGGGWQAVGYEPERGAIVLISRLTGALVHLGAQQLNDREVALRFGAAALADFMNLDQESKRSRFDSNAFLQAVHEACIALGPFDPDRVRGPGVYRDGRGLVINDGRTVYRDNGQPLDVTPQRGGHVYVAGRPLGFTSTSALASTEDLSELVRAVQSFGYARPADARLVLGWMGMVTLGQALEHRPLLVLTAGRGSGKTTLVEMMGRILGDQVLSREGVPTKAQVIRALQNRSAGLILDEFEARAKSPGAMKDLFELLRVGFTGLRNGAPYARTEPGGKLQHFNAPTGALLAGIAIPALNEATESRAAHVNLGRLPSRSGFRGDEISWLFDAERASDAEALGRRVRALLIQRWSVVRESLHRLTAQLLALGHDARRSSVWATLLACYLGITHKRAPDESALRELLAEHGLVEAGIESSDQEGSDCLRFLISRRITVVRLKGDRKVREQLSVQEIISAVVHGEEDEREALAQQLHAFGLRLLKRASNSPWTLAVRTSEKAERLAMMFRSTDWSAGGWKHVLSRLPGASREVVRVDGIPQRVVVVPLCEELVAPPRLASLHDAD